MLLTNWLRIRASHYLILRTQLLCLNSSPKSGTILPTQSPLYYIYYLSPPAHKEMHGVRSIERAWSTYALSRCVILPRPPVFLNPPPWVLLEGSVLRHNWLNLWPLAIECNLLAHHLSPLRRSGGDTISSSPLLHGWFSRQPVRPLIASKVTCNNPRTISIILNT